MAKYVKLGEKAQKGMFSDPMLKLKVLPNQVVELPKNYRISQRIVKAIAHGHLVITDKNDTIHDDDDDDDETPEVNATDSAIALMAENGVKPSEVTGSGAEGRITKKDVEAFLED